MDKDKVKKSIGDYHKEHREANWPMNNWRSWGSWFSWGSPIGLALFFSIPMVVFGIMYWLMHH